MSYYRPVFKDDNLNEIASADYIATEYVYNRQSLNDLTHGFPVLVNPKTVDTPRSTPTSSSASSHTKRNRTIHNMKKLFNKDKKKASTGDLSDIHAAQQPGHTLDRIVSLKAEEKRKWELEKEEFDRRQREHEIHLLEIEQKEVERREEEVRKRNDDLSDKRRKNKMVQDKMMEQIKALEQKLIEFRTSHQKEEEDLEDAVRTMEDQLFEVKSDMEKRMRNLNLAFDSAHSSSPHDTMLGGKRDSLNSEFSQATTIPALASAPPNFDDVTDGFDTITTSKTGYGLGPAGMYPAIPVMTRSYETSKVMQVGGAEGGNPTPQPRSSLGSSPKSSPSPCDSPPDQRHHASLAVGAGAGVDNQSDKSAEFGEFGSASSV